VTRPPDSIPRIGADVVGCRRCPRLVEHREAIARIKVRRFRDQDYWGRPVPGFGDPRARLLVVGLAPAAHGGNRTGRVFTGDRSGDWLFRALHRAKFANQPRSAARGDGLALDDCYVSAAVRCAPPDNQPLPAEFANCRPYLVREIEALADLRCIVALGARALDAVVRAWRDRGRPAPARVKFRHGLELELDRAVRLIASYHPSQQNTQTGRLTAPMLDAIFAAARRALR
jgi:uracil-DNA glycosylase family 4